jgi:hypothetical protein
MFPSSGEGGNIYCVGLGLSNEPNTVGSPSSSYNNGTDPISEALCSVVVQGTHGCYEPKNTAFKHLWLNFITLYNRDLGSRSMQMKPNEEKHIY